MRVAEKGGLSENEGNCVWEEEEKREKARSKGHQMMDSDTSPALVLCCCLSASL